MIANLTQEINALESSSVAPIAQPDLVGFITEIETKRPMEDQHYLNDIQSDLEFQGIDWEEAAAAAAAADTQKGKGNPLSTQQGRGRGKGRRKRKIESL